MRRVDVRPDEWLNEPVLVRETDARLPREGILIGSLDRSGRLNPMTIGWGVFGWIWSRPIFTVLVRPSRYTYGCIEATGDFTVNVQPDDATDWVHLCGTASGRDVDKMSELGLTPLPSRMIASPGIAECPIVFECKVVHCNDLAPASLAGDILSEFYADGDYHRVYFGQVLAVSASEELMGGST
jgi:flavin reductase (DIM6/NTAB) family NADH-FMN oxidoreductase RutF